MKKFGDEPFKNANAYTLQQAHVHATRYVGGLFEEQISLHLLVKKFPFPIEIGTSHLDSESAQQLQALDITIRALTFAPLDLSIPR